MTFQFGLERLLTDSDRLATLKSARVGLVAHPASVTQDLTHALDALVGAGIYPKCVFGPQHGVRGDKQDNMIESDDYLDPTHGIPVYSLYGHHRRPTPERLAGLDIILFDLQDLGCRIYTYITTLQYFLAAAASTELEIWVLDRPNPAGRGIDGFRLEAGQESFVGAAALPCRYGLTIGELALWMNAQLPQPANLTFIEMRHYSPNTRPSFGWPSELSWVNPSPNASSLNMARSFSGTVLLEGTTLSEGRGTTFPLEVIGGPGFPAQHIKAELESSLSEALAGAVLRPCYFEPTFHKHQGKLCQGLQIHTEQPQFNAETFQPFRIIAYALKLLKLSEPKVELWRHHEYEYETGRVPIDVINGGPQLRQWVDDDTQSLAQLTHQLDATRALWLPEIAPFYRY
ncbi:DUF1343 domain-containing protein [Pseudomonadales bacterium]|nr:DUF1343 domain-containing protein [Pseudomonadales bacterium]MDA8950526.1 DUF1343 domain-containing protein [Pseudomonadales bacterium]